MNGNVRFIWNNGGGAGVVWKPLHEGPEDVLPDGPVWYKIIIERFVLKELKSEGAHVNL